MNPHPADFLGMGGQVWGSQSDTQHCSCQFQISSCPRMEQPPVYYVWVNIRLQRLSIIITLSRNEIGCALKTSVIIIATRFLLNDRRLLTASVAIVIPQQSANESIFMDNECRTASRVLDFTEQFTVHIWMSRWRGMFGRNSGPPPLVVSWRSLARLAKVGQLFHRPSIAAQQALLQVVEWFLQLHDLTEIWGFNTISNVL